MDLAPKIKAQRLIPSDKFRGVFWGSRQVNTLRGFCGGDGAKWVLCRLRWECFGCFIEEGALWGVIFHSYLLTIKRFMGVFNDHYCDPTLFWLIVGLKANSWVWKGWFWNIAFDFGCWNLLLILSWWGRYFQMFCFICNLWIRWGRHQLQLLVFRLLISTLIRYSYGVCMYAYYMSAWHMYMELPKGR